MSKINSPPEYQSFDDFYAQHVIPYTKLNPTHIRLDGNILGSSRKISAYFWYVNKKWKVDADTYIDRLKLAFDQSEKTNEPFRVKNTRDKKGECLIIKEQPLKNKKFYVYKVGQK
ncbi:hypothetical protein HDF26_004016 [Pedobacter cryoconitis]|uniref:hypothetical protein n=1 Tax=Pedobacter cryoconitis TaxID=188932 RepID=UPI00161EC9AB|nr:hypothetical protein [Pedobacter cryoconitis]MBB6273556.1 hypothetical protein [Pedobacter cryoconitis]